MEQTPNSNLLQDVEQELFLEPAPKGLRFANYLLDVIFFYILVFVLAFGFVGAAVASGQDFDESVMAGSGGSAVLLQYLISIIIVVGYYTIFEGSSGRTLGKLVTGTVAVRHDGSKLTWKDAFLRSLCRLIPFEAFSGLGVAPWHDTITRTTVIKRRR